MFEEFSLAIDQYLIIDLIGFLSTLVYLNLIIKQKRSAWYWSILGSAIFAYSCFSNQLYIQSALFVFYILIAFYGLRHWRASNLSLKVKSMNFTTHSLFITSSLILGSALGYVFITFTDQQLPYLDGIISIFAIGTTLLVVDKKRENWLYWMGINAASMYLYYKQDMLILLVMALVLFAVAIRGYYAWNYNSEITSKPL